MSQNTVSNMVTLQCPESKKVFFTNVRTFATLDMQTGKSVPLSQLDHNMPNFKNLFSDKPSPLPVLDLPPSGEYFSNTIRASHSDMNLLFHVNSATYVRYCMDCATEASLAGFTRTISGDPCFLPVAKLETFHAGENFAGEDLEVCTWEQDGETMYFLIFNKRKAKKVFHCCITYRPPITD